MPQMKRSNADGMVVKPKPKKEEKMTEEEYEDHLDYCVAVEAIDEALEEGGIMRTRDFARELGFDF
jgi:hypothetical protein